jgi:hypothetical protein
MPIRGDQAKTREEIGHGCGQRMTSAFTPLCVSCLQGNSRENSAGGAAQVTKPSSQALQLIVGSRITRFHLCSRMLASG